MNNARDAPEGRAMMLTLPDRSGHTPTIRDLAMLSTCVQCGAVLGAEARFCPQCGHPQPSRTSEGRKSPVPTVKEEMNMTILYAMVGILIFAVLFPPWETPPGQPPAFLGFYPLWSRPQEGVVSNMLLIIETSTIAIGGIYASWLFRRRR